MSRHRPLGLEVARLEHLLPDGWRSNFAAPESKTIDQYSYSYWNISISVEGDFKNITNFIENIDGKYLSTANVISAVLDQSEENP